MKNSVLLGHYLDACEETYRLMIAARGSQAALQRYNAHITEAAEEHARMWQGLLAEGWTIEEIDAAYSRRIGHVNQAERHTP